jgi:predicted HNH restriction endonuclease
MRWDNEDLSFFAINKGIVALGYYNDDYEPVIGDSTNIPENDFNKLCNCYSSQKNSLRNIIYKMKIHDVIYLQGYNSIIAKGNVASSYKYNKSVMEGVINCRWEHYREVKWDFTFSKIEFLRSESPFRYRRETLLKMDKEMIEFVQKYENIISDIKSLEFEYGIEGKSKQMTVSTYERDPRVRKRALEIHGFICKVCGFNFYEQYGDIGKDYIEVHHEEPLSSFNGEHKVNPETELTVLCSNCHRMIHRNKNKKIKSDELKLLLKNNS